MRLRAPFLAVLVAALALTACGSKEDKSKIDSSGKGDSTREASTPVSNRTTSGTLALTEKDSGRTVSVRVDGVVTLKLEENVTTGFSWAITREADAAVLKLVSNDYQEPGSPTPPVVGAAGLRTVTFKAVAKGSTNVELQYRRTWEKDATPASAFTVTIVVGD